MINMNSVAGVMATLIVLSILFLLLGNRFFRLFHMKERLQFQWLFGFFLFLAVFCCHRFNDRKDSSTISCVGICGDSYVCTIRSVLREMVCKRKWS